MSQRAPSHIIYYTIVWRINVFMFVLFTHIKLFLEQLQGSDADKPDGSWMTLGCFTKDGVFNDSKDPKLIIENNSIYI